MLWGVGVKVPFQNGVRTPHLVVASLLSVALSFGVMVSSLRHRRAPEQSAILPLQEREGQVEGFDLDEGMIVVRTAGGEELSLPVSAQTTFLLHGRRSA